MINLTPALGGGGDGAFSLRDLPVLTTCFSSEIPNQSISCTGTIWVAMARRQFRSQNRVSLSRGKASAEKSPREFLRLSKAAKSAVEPPVMTFLGRCRLHFPCLESPDNVITGQVPLKVTS